MENPNTGNSRRLLCLGGDRGSEDTKRQRDDEGKLSARLHFRLTSPRQDPYINMHPFSKSPNALLGWIPDDGPLRPTTTAIDVSVQPSRPQWHSESASQSPRYPPIQASQRCEPCERTYPRPA